MKTDTKDKEPRKKKSVTLTAEGEIPCKKLEDAWLTLHILKDKTGRTMVSLATEAIAFVVSPEAKHALERFRKIQSTREDSDGKG